LIQDRYGSLYLFISSVALKLQFNQFSLTNLLLTICIWALLTGHYHQTITLISTGTADFVFDSVRLFTTSPKTCKRSRQ
jgi:hypothetical protein